MENLIFGCCASSVGDRRSVDGVCSSLRTDICVGSLCYYQSAKGNSPCGGGGGGVSLGRFCG